MEIILQKAIFDDVKLKKYITKIVVQELNNLTIPCHQPQWKNHFFELIKLTKLDEKDIKLFAKRFYLQTKTQLNLDKYNKVSMLTGDVGSNFLIILMHYFLKKRDVKTHSMFMIFYMIRQYSNLFHRSFPEYCKPEVFEYTLNHLNPTHLFVREKNISNTLFHLATAMNRRFSTGILNGDPNKISDFVFASRTSISQSLKSFAEAYYRFQEEGQSMENPFETEDGEEISKVEVKKGEKTADLVSKKICMYKEIDNKTIEEARKLTKINTSLCILIAKGLQDVSFTNDVKFIIELFLKDMTSVKQICGKEFLSYVKKLMGLKRTTKSIFFKREINSLLLKILEKNNYTKKYLKLTSQTRFQINSFLSFYITIYTKNTIC